MIENRSGVFSLTGWISTRVIKPRHMTEMLRRFIVKYWSVIVCVFVCACTCAMVGMSGIHYDAVTSGCRLYWLTIIRNQNKWEMKIKNMNMLALNSVSCMSLFFYRAVLWVGCFVHSKCEKQEVNDINSHRLLSTLFLTWEWEWTFVN